MNIIFFSRREGRARHVNLGHPLAVAGFATLLVAILATAFSLGMKIGESRGSVPRGVATWSQTLAEQQAEIKELKAELQRRVDAVAMRIGQMNAHVIRLDALGKRLTQMANIDHREFDFETAPAIGGPESSDIGAAMQAPDLNALLNGLEQKISSRDAQLAALENALLSKKLDEQIRPDGRPVRAGHISSYFGERQDPFNGHQAFHKGIDFAAPRGSDVVAVAAGVVTFAGEKVGYGTLVEVNHGNGLITRYGHNQSVAVGVGHTVARGDTLAYVGSTGRSTGPHVHFEVLKNGRQINPLTFIGR